MIRLRRNSSQVHLTDIVKVSMWDFFLRCQLFHLIQQDVHLKLGAKILQTTVAEGLSVAKGNKGFVHTASLSAQIRLFCLALHITFQMWPTSDSSVGIQDSGFSTDFHVT